MAGDNNVDSALDNVDLAALSALSALGFERGLCVRALREQGHHLHRAAQWLLNLN
eukprot:CAMPEP_0177733780 /NCGR_PEP_ID=MMETSP0484_2-20121128/23871_1 /TAXON_ID=354590 /ORGANISM="Rhodomonas lens, Strain RHODO" /LENGTH=54 /DNA_ID=CAMNT_0019247191 /DNA_START=44 /DNA_END=205 /DNA_ORIENTATION=-